MARNSLMSFCCSVDSNNSSYNYKFSNGRINNYTKIVITKGLVV
ncbi:MAG: hypothetical protein ACJA0N_002779 [Pseudohongiellaceae bacterium]|jgi:hypothetical protein